ncbi:MAG TPA: STM3941 family protein [Mucilaginibacter sp.]|nr:STM3941 family protein [Mucilaginibacter sp.]
MMNSTTAYLYSKKNGFVTLVVLLILGLLFISNIFKANQTNDRIDVYVFALLTAALAFALVVLIAKRLMPALKNEVVLEFNEKGIIDYLRNVTIDWKDIKSIDFKRTRSSSMIWLRLKWESDYGSQIFISLRWVTGKDNDIYRTAVSYFNSFADAEAENEA